MLLWLVLRLLLHLPKNYAYSILILPLAFNSSQQFSLAVLQEHLKKSFPFLFP
jgi:hypothetical protein